MVESWTDVARERNALVEAMREARAAAEASTGGYSKRDIKRMETLTPEQIRRLNKYRRRHGQKQLRKDWKTL